MSSSSSAASVAVETRSRARRRGGQRGAIAHMVVIAAAISIAGVVFAAEANVSGFAREERRLVSSDEAFALAESGVALARAQLERDGHWAGLDREPLGRGEISVVVEPLADGDFAVVATGRVVASVLGGRPGPISRRVRVQLAYPSQPGPDGVRLRGALGRMRIVDWKEL